MSLARTFSNYSLWVALPILGTLYQAGVKKLALSLGDTPLSMEWFVTAIHSPWTFIVLMSEVASFLLWMNVLSTVCVSKAVPITAISYVFILLSGWVIFDEPVKLLQLVGSAMIVWGIWLICTAKAKP